MWRPRKLGKIMVERKLRFVRPRRPARSIVVRFGQPVRSPRPRRGDPWWCPIQITGLTKSRWGPIAGEDSLQSLVLALEFITHVLPVEARRAGGQVEWLGERERLVFANTLSAGLARMALHNAVEGLSDAIDILDNGQSRQPARVKKTVQRLKLLVASAGYPSAIVLPHDDRRR